MTLLGPGDFDRVACKMSTRLWQSAIHDSSVAARTMNRMVGREQDGTEFHGKSCVAAASTGRRRRRNSDLLRLKHRHGKVRSPCFVVGELQKTQSLHICSVAECDVHAITSYPRQLLI